MQRALVIGATGFVGRHVVDALLEHRVEVAGMHGWHSETEMLEERGIETLAADLKSGDDLVAKFAGFNFVFHCAMPHVGDDDWAYLGASVRAIRRVLNAARQADVERIAVTSCATTVQPQGGDDLADEHDVYLPGTAQDNRVEAQYAVELECAREAADNLDLVILNPSICLGDGASFPSPRALSSLDPDAPLDVVDVASVAKAHLDAIERFHLGERVVLGGRRTTAKQVRAAMELRPDGTGELWGHRVDLVDNLAELRHRRLFTDGVWLDSSTARDELGFRPDRPTPDQ